MSKTLGRALSAVMIGFGLAGMVGNPKTLYGWVCSVLAGVGIILYISVRIEEL